MPKSLEQRYEESQKALRDIAELCGATVGKECSHEFHCLVVEEVRAVLTAAEARAAKAENTLNQIREYVNTLSKVRTR